MASPCCLVKIVMAVRTLWSGPLRAGGEQAPTAAPAAAVEVRRGRADRPHTVIGATATLIVVGAQNRRAQNRRAHNRRA